MSKMAQIHRILTIFDEFDIILHNINLFIMAITNLVKEKIKELKLEYEKLRVEKEALLTLIDENEIPESVYNSNAIENSTLTLKETEKILLDMEVSRDVSVREVFEAKNLDRVIEYIRNKSKEAEINKELILFLHQMLIGGINDNISGRFRKQGEYVRVGNHIAPGPEKIEEMINTILTEYVGDVNTYFLDKISKFHLEFESIHPFNDGNGRIGRTIICYQLQRLGFPMIIIRDKGKKGYYDAFQEYKEKKNIKLMDKIISLALLESLHKRITYLKGDAIIKLSDYAKAHKRSSSSLLNSARHQNIPAFRERGV